MFGLPYLDLCLSIAGYVLARTGDLIIDGRSSLCSSERGDVLVRRRVAVFEEGRRMSGALRNADDEINRSDTDNKAPIMLCREDRFVGRR